MTNKTNETAVEYFELELSKIFSKISIDNYLFYIAPLFDKAKEMEKEQMRKIYSSPITTNEDGNFVIKSFEQYYNETYGGKNE